MSSLGGLVGGIIGIGSSQGDKERAEDALKRARGNWDYNTQVAGQSGTEMDRIDPSSRDAMKRALSDYQNRAQQGGMDAIGRATLAEGLGEGETAAAASSRQIGAQAAREGRAQGPAAMIQQQVAAQQGAQRAKGAGLQAAEMAEMGRERALQGQVGTAAGIYGIDANRAAAQDAINRFNVLNAQRNVQNNVQQAEGRTGVDEREAGMYEGRAGRDVKDFGEMGAGIGGSTMGVVKDVMTLGGSALMGGGNQSWGWDPAAARDMTGGSEII